MINFLPDSIFELLMIDRNTQMNAIKYALAVAVMALSATVSAQVVFVPDFPVKKPAETQTATATATADAPAAAPHQEA